nr:hypothetical protein [Tanacetum cinerariifolium]
MVEQNCEERLIRRFTRRGKQPDPRDDDGSEDVNPFGGGNPRFQDDHYDNPLLTKKTESEPIIWDIGDEKEEYPFVNKYPSFQKEPIVLVEKESGPVYEIDNEEEESMPVYDNEKEEYPFVNKYLSFLKEPIVLVEEESCLIYDIDNEKEISMPVYDTDIEDVIEEEEGFVRKGGFGREEDNIEDVVVVANDLCSLMIQTILSVDFEEDINTKSHVLMSFEKKLLS